MRLIVFALCSILLAVPVTANEPTVESTPEIELTPEYIVEEIEPTHERWENFKEFICNVMQVDERGCEMMYGLRPGAQVSEFPPHSREVVRRFFEEHVVGQSNIDTTPLIKALFEALPDDGMYSDENYRHGMSFGGGFATFRMQAVPNADMGKGWFVAEYIHMITWKEKPREEGIKDVERSD